MSFHHSLQVISALKDHSLQVISALKDKKPRAGGDTDDQLCVCLATNHTCTHFLKLEHAF